MSPDNFLLVILILLLLPLLIPFITAPLRIRLHNWHAADPGYEPCEEEPLPPEVTGMIDDLQELGFDYRGHWRFAGGSHATGQLVLLEHPQTLDVAKVIVVTTSTRQQATLALQTRFADGTEVVTANSRLTIGLPPIPGITGVWLPEVRDTRHLYRIHGQVRDSLGGARKRIPVGKDPAAFLREGSSRVHAHWVKTGYYYLDEAHGVFRPTWKGAFLMSWRLTRPVRPLFFAWRKRSSRRLLRHLGVSLEAD